MKRDGRDKFMDIPGRMTLIEGELTDHENTVQEEMSALRTEMKTATSTTNRLLFSMLVVLLTVLGGLIATLAAGR